MSRRTWRDLARQQKGSAPAVPAAGQPTPADIGKLAERVPALQSLLEKRKALEQRMQSLGASAPDDRAGPDPRFPVASMAERRAELERWTRRHEQRLADPRAALDQRARQAPADSWQQLRDGQAGRAMQRSRDSLSAKHDLMQRLDQRVSAARNTSRQRLRESRERTLQTPLTRPLDKPAADRLDAPMQATRAERATTRDGFDQRYQQRMKKLLGEAGGLADDLARRRQRQLEQRREQAREQRLEARRAERQDMMKRERARERRAQRPQLSTD